MVKIGKVSAENFGLYSEITKNSVEIGPGTGAFLDGAAPGLTHLHDLTMLRHTCLFTDNLLLRFSSLKDSDRKRLLESLVQTVVEVYQAAQEKSKAMAIRSDTKAAGLRGEQEQIKALIIGNRDRLIRAEEQSVSHAATIAADRAKLEGELSVLQEKGVQDNRSLCLCADSIVECEKRAAGIKEEVTATVAAYDAALPKKAQCLAVLQSLKADFGKAEALIKAGHCPHCGAEVDSDHLCSTVIDLNTKIEAFEAAADEAQKQIRKFLSEKQEANNRFNRISTEERKLRDDHGILRESLAKTETKINSIQKVLGSAAPVNVYAGEVIRLRGQIVASKNDLLSTGADLKAEDAQAQVARFWGDNGFSVRGIRSRILDEVLTFLNRKLEYYVSYLTDGKLVVKLVPGGGKRDAILLDVGTTGGSYEASCSGEKRRIDFALQLGFADLVSEVTGFDTNVKVFDEVLDTLDRAGIAKLIDLLREISVDKTVILVTHNPVAASLVDRVWTARRQNDNTVLEVE